MKRDTTTRHEKIKAQSLEIRDSGLTNLFDSKRVQQIANERKFYELVCFIEDHPDRYAKFIMSGDDNLLHE